MARLKRLSVYFGDQRMAWSLAIVATLVGAITEPLIPALLQPLLDKGFTQGTLQLWMVPLAILGFSSSAALPSLWVNMHWRASPMKAC